MCSVGMRGSSHARALVWEALLAGCVVGLADGAELQPCPPLATESARCELTQPNFTHWCNPGEEEPEYETYYYFTHTKSCHEVSRENMQTIQVPPGQGTVLGGTLKRCTLCAPFPLIEECRRVCEDHDRDWQLSSDFIQNVFIALYACYGLAICCEDYFVSSLEILIEKMQMPADVAGATFMAAGSSSPELFVAAVTIFLPQDSDKCQPGHPCYHKDPGLGVGTVIGSTMFNTMCIIGGSAIVSGKTTTLDWRIVARDGTSYAFAVLTLMYVLIDEVCEPGMCNEHKDVNGHDVAGADLNGWGTVRWYEALAMVCVYAGYVVLCWKYSALTGWLCPKRTSENPGLDAWLADYQAPSSAEDAVAAPAAAESGGAAGNPARFTVTENKDDGHNDGADEHGHGSRDESYADTLRNLFKTPGADEPWACVVWVISLPLMVVFALTIFDCRNRRFEHFYLLTMLISICWLGIIVSQMVHAFEDIAEDLGMDQATVGLVFSAAGTSFPDFLASLIVAKKGLADMAVRTHDRDIWLPTDLVLKRAVSAACRPSVTDSPRSCGAYARASGIECFR